MPVLATKTVSLLGLVEAANFLAAAVHEEKPVTSGDLGAGVPDEAPAPFAYNLGKALKPSMNDIFVGTIFRYLP